MNSVGSKGSSSSSSKESVPRPTACAASSCDPDWSTALPGCTVAEVHAAAVLAGESNDRGQIKTAPQMLDLGAGARAGLLLTRHLPDNVLQRLQARYTPPTGVSTGTSLCLNKRLCSRKTQHLVGWSPRRTDASPRSSPAPTPTAAES